MAVLTSIDWAVVALYGVLVVAIVSYVQRRGRSSSEFLLAGKRVPGWVIAASLLATSFSSISLVSIPSEGYLRGFGYAQLWIGELIAAALVVWLFVPAYRRAGVTTAYEFIAQRFGGRARAVASLGFALVTLVRAALLLLLTARALEVFSGLPLATSILLIGGTAMLYSTLGGLATVVWMDVLQFGVIVVGLGGAAWWLYSGLPGGVGTVLAANSAEAGRPAIDIAPSLSTWPSLLSVVFAYTVPLLYVGGTNQQMVQRYAACRDAASARRAVLGAWALGAAVGGTALLLGAMLFARVGPGYAAPDRELLTWFVREAPSGLGGVMAAAIFAAAMSSVDSAVHALATATLVDGIEARRGAPLPERRRLRWARTLTILYGLLATGGAILLIEWAGGETIFQRLVSWLALFSGPGLGLFLLALPRRRVSEGAALIGVAAGLGVAALLGERWGGVPSRLEDLGIAGVWKGPLGLVVTLAVALLASPWLPRRAPASTAADSAPPRPGGCS